jgi:hypothetical protein
MKKITMSFALSILLSSAAHADFLDRVDACEQSGQFACVFDLLREVGRNGGHGGPEHREPVRTVPLQPGFYSDFDMRSERAPLSVLGDLVTFRNCVYRCVDLSCSSAAPACPLTLIITGPTNFSLNFPNTPVRSFFKNDSN